MNIRSRVLFQRAAAGLNYIPVLIPLHSNSNKTLPLSLSLRCARLVAIIRAKPISPATRDLCGISDQVFTGKFEAREIFRLDPSTKCVLWKRPVKERAPENLWNFSAVTRTRNSENAAKSTRETTDGIFRAVARNVIKSRNNDCFISEELQKSENWRF